MWLEAGEGIGGLTPGVDLVKGERILMEVSRKFTQDKLRSLAFQSGFFWQVRAALRVVLLMLTMLMLMPQSDVRDNGDGLMNPVRLLLAGAGTPLWAPSLRLRCLEIHFHSDQWLRQHLADTGPSRQSRDASNPSVDGGGAGAAAEALQTACGS